MDIYIYGDGKFRKKIHTILDHSNIKFKIDGVVEDVDELEKLKQLIKDNPNQIYLIDQNKIIEENLSSKIFKFLIPKDGVTKTFLDKYGIGDISIRDYDDLGIYITKRLEAIEAAKPKAHEITSIDEMLEDDTVEALNMKKE